MIPAVLGGVITQSWAGVWTGLIWGGLVRVFLVHHVTWSVNSACHLWGMRPYRSHDQSRNNVVFGPSLWDLPGLSESHFARKSPTYIGCAFANL